MDAPTTLPLPDACDTAPRAEFLRGLRAAVPVMIGFIPFALVLGAQAAQKGLSALEVPLMTGLNFAGGSEFAAVELWTSPPHIALIVAITALVNSRHLLMGASLAPLLIHWTSVLTIVLMAAATYLTRIVGFLALRNRTLSRRAVTVMEAAPGCVLISVIAPDFVADKPADLGALAITLLAATRLSMLPTVLIGVVSAGVLRYLMG
ncbi:AzlC family ABC transporter permease [Stenotrophomonas sp. GD03993]|nr:MULTISPECIES: AzlC family ABC transporter permease [unclassified Stenotrophomonas]MDH0190573.1 AzlC family ABC transporter permease [Stenotrophomonas sp. GD04051]MDH0466167.1 AzlC family ABC transporter permease [Stenotrophomonas sp. GD03993]MDH0878079.1 AzlC family ABC transporter permease [Stenotrophomonas sp. GD03877]